MTVPSSAPSPDDIEALPDRFTKGAAIRQALSAIATGSQRLNLLRAGFQSDRVASAIARRALGSPRCRGGALDDPVSMIPPMRAT